MAILTIARTAIRTAPMATLTVRQTVLLRARNKTQDKRNPLQPRVIPLKSFLLRIIKVVKTAKRMQTTPTDFLIKKQS